MKTVLFIGFCALLVACAPSNPVSDTSPLQIPEIVSDQPAQQPSVSIDDIDHFEFQGISGWFNLEGATNNSMLTKKELRGKVVLVDFWTYSCINCIRTLPYLTSWDEKYRDDGLAIVGIHTPEFAFEKKPENVQEAINKHSIKYPAGLDNDFATWKAYKNSYWPHVYVFDRSGNFVFHHIGEGGYEEIEKKLQELLAAEENITEMEAPRFLSISTPEIYLGGVSSRGNVAYDLTLGEHVFILPEKAERNTVQPGGTWIVGNEYIEAKQDSRLRLLYHAKDIHVVAGGQGTVSGTLDGSLIKKADISQEQLYTLSSTDYKDHTILLNVSPGVKLYTFTFG